MRRQEQARPRGQGSKRLEGTGGGYVSTNSPAHSKKLYLRISEVGFYARPLINGNSPSSDRGNRYKLPFRIPPTCGHSARSGGTLKPDWQLSCETGRKRNFSKRPQCGQMDLELRHTCVFSSLQKSCSGNPMLSALFKCRRSRLTTGASIAGSN